MPPIRWFEPVVVLAAALAHGIWSSVQMADHWFMNDFWAHLGDRGLSLDELLNGHGGHWAFFNILVANGLTDWFGLEYWPAFGVLRAVAWAALGTWAWWSTRRLGAEPAIAISAAFLILAFGGGYWFKPWLINIPLGHFAWVTGSIIIGGEQSNRRRALLTVVLMVGVAASSQTSLFAIAAVLYCGAVRRMRFWLPPLLAALAVWFVWSAVFSASPTAAENVEWSFQTAVSMPYLMFELLSNTVARFADVSTLVGGMCLIAAGSAFVYRVLSKRTITSHAAISGIYILLVGAATTVNRILPGTAPTDAVRYVLFAIPMIFGLAPSIRFPQRNSYRVASVVVLAALVGYLASSNMQQSRAGYNFDAVRSMQSEQLANTIGYLIANDVPYQPQQGLRSEAPASGLLRFGQLADLLDDGWEPEPVRSLIGRAQSIMTLSSSTAAQPGATCDQVAGRTEIVGNDFLIVGEPLDRVTLTWESVVGTHQDQRQLGSTGELRVSIREPRTSKLFVDPTASGLRLCVD